MDKHREELDFNQIAVQRILAEWLTEAGTALDVLRLDLLHPLIGGNKWFKLKYYLRDAQKNNFESIATFGGAYSNHIIATAFACKQAGMRSIGLIRGEEPAQYSHTLTAAKDLGMDFYFLNRTAYRYGEIPGLENYYLIREGGYGQPGKLGASEILSMAASPEKYTHIVSAVGTGTTLAGLIEASGAQQQVIGIPVLKGEDRITGQIRNLLGTGSRKNFVLEWGFDFGGYAKFPGSLRSYMNLLWEQHRVPTDFIYTAKAFFATEQLIRNKRIPPGSRVVLIHTGGLQGNLSLSPGTLQF